jgi:hypothetical protein
MNRTHSQTKLAQIVYALCLDGSEVLAWRLARSLNATIRARSVVWHEWARLLDCWRLTAFPSYAYVRRSGIDLRLHGTASSLRHSRMLRAWHEKASVGARRMLSLDVLRGWSAKSGMHSSDDFPSTGTSVIHVRTLDRGGWQSQNGLAV